MYIYWKKPNGSEKEIYGANDSIDNIYGQLVDVLGIGSGCNMFSLLKNIAEYEIPSPKGCIYSAWVEKIDPCIIRIWYATENNPRDRTILVANINADKVTPDEFGKAIGMKVLANLSHIAGIVTDGIGELLLRGGR